MTGTADIDINFMYSVILREAENDPIQEIEPNFYLTISEFLGNLKQQEFDGVEDKIKERMINIATELIRLLIVMRLDKISKLEKSEINNLLDEEKFILDAHEQQRERVDVVLSAITRGKFMFLESISQKHKTKPVVVRFLQDVNEIVGSDLKKYGPFKTEDIASVPYENAQALITKNAATKVRWED